MKLWDSRIEQNILEMW